MTKTKIIKRPPCPKCGTLLARSGFTPANKQRWVCRAGCGYTTTDPSAPARSQGGEKTKVQNKPLKFKRKLGGVKRFVITAAQNGTPVHMPFLAALERYCGFNDAELIVIPIRYKNPTSTWTASQVNEQVWDPLVKPYLYNQRKKLCPSLVLLADIKTRPTAEKPLSSFESITHGESGILGHTKLQLTTIPTPQGRYPKVLTTTGAITVANYTDSKAGKKGEFHHTLGAVAVDVVGKKFFMRQINADKKTGDFIDLEYLYRAEGLVTKAPRPLGIAFGDTHRRFMDPTVEKTTFGKGGIVETLDPEHLIFHDLHDGYAENPHHAKDPFSKIAKRRDGSHRIHREIQEDVGWLEKVVGKRKAIIVASNHDNFLSRYIVNTDWRYDPDNAEFYLETAMHMARSAKMGAGGASRLDPFQYWVNRLHPRDNIRCLGVNESFVLGDIEMALHGDLGPNGARGSRQNLRRIGVKTVIGHSHSPGIEEGCYQVGTSSPLRLEYNTGPSSWLHTHCVVYANGKRCLLNIIDGEWRF